MRRMSYWIGKLILSAVFVCTLAASSAQTKQRARLMVQLGHSGIVTSTDISPDNRLVVTAGFDHTVRLWDAETGKELRILDGHAGKVDSVCFSPDGRYILTGSDDNTLRFWDVATGKEMRRIQGTGDRNIYQAILSQNGRLILTVGEGIVDIWDTETGKQQRRIALLGSPADVALSSDSKYFAAADGTGGFDLWDAASTQKVWDIESSDNYVRSSSVAFSPDGRQIATGNARDGHVYVREAATGKEIRR